MIIAIAIPMTQHFNLVFIYLSLVHFVCNLPGNLISAYSANLTRSFNNLFIWALSLLLFFRHWMSSSFNFCIFSLKSLTTFIRALFCSFSVVRDLVQSL